MISDDLFPPVSRDERQDESVTKWLKANGKGTIVAATGVGKTVIAVKCIKKVRSKYPNMSVLVVVPTSQLRDQWESELKRWEVAENTAVRVMMGASKFIEDEALRLKADMLIIDEAHRINAEGISHIFENVAFTKILGLTATFERLDGRHEILAKYAPVVDTITMQEALLNGWVAKYKDYVVLIDVDDLSVYQDLEAQFNTHFEFFDRDFQLVMSMVGPTGFINKIKYRDAICAKTDLDKKEVLKAINIHANGFVRVLQSRKKFVQEHPKKLAVAEEIIQARPNSKIITFSANTKVAESFSSGYVYTGKEGKKKNRMTLEEFSKLPAGQLNTVKLAEEGMNLPDLSVGIMLGVNSSKTKAVQTLGRVVRLAKGKTAEFFTLVINDTVEAKWMQNSRIDDNFEVIDVENLRKVLRGEPYELYKRKLKNFTFRF